MQRVLRLLMAALACLPLASSVSVGLSAADEHAVRQRLMLGLERRLSRLDANGTGGHARRTRSSSGGEAEDSFLMYIPVGGSAGSVRCPTASDSIITSIQQMAFLSTALNIFSITANVSNNINNNNNNNNRNSMNVQSSNNVVTNTNVINGNQVNVMVPVLNP